MTIKYGLTSLAAGECSAGRAAGRVCGRVCGLAGEPIGHPTGSPSAAPAKRLVSESDSESPGRRLATVAAQANLDRSTRPATVDLRVYAPKT